MPSIPQIILRVREISEDPKSSVVDLANIILSDHALTSKTLKIANSAFYAEFASKVSTVTQAITLMGFRSVQNVVISLALYDSVRAMGEHHKFDFRQFWTHSLSTGVIGKMIASAARYKTPEEAFIAGFMHNIGVAILAVIFPEEYDVVLKKIGNGEDQLSAEKAVFGVDHTEVGGWLAKKWNLPPILAKPITDHHRLRIPAKQRSQHMIVDIVYLSDSGYHLILNLGPGNEAALASFRQVTFDLVGVSEQQLDKIIDNAPDLIREIARELDIALKAPETKGQPAPPAAAMQHEAVEMAQKLNDRNRELATMQEAGEAIRAARSEEEIIQTTLEEIFRGMGIGRAILLRVDHDAKLVKGILGFGVDSQQAVYDLIFPLVGGVFGATVADRQGHNILDAGSEVSRDLVQPEERAGLGVLSFATMPIEIADKVEMVMVLNNPDSTEPIDDDRLRAIGSLIAQASMGIERLRLRKQLAEMKGQEVNGLVNTAFNR
jgi:HD-like signal output (HDOD) protein